MKEKPDKSSEKGVYVTIKLDPEVECIYRRENENIFA